MFSEVIRTKEEAEEFLYHYTTMETLLFYILSQKILRFSEMRKTNDPEEFNENGYQMSDDLRILENEEEREKWISKFFENQKLFSDLLQKDAKILCCSKDNFMLSQESLQYNGRGFLSRECELNMGTITEVYA